MAPGEDDRARLEELDGLVRDGATAEAWERARTAAENGSPALLARALDLAAGTAHWSEGVALAGSLEAAGGEEDLAACGGFHLRRARALVEAGDSIAATEAVCDAIRCRPSLRLEMLDDPVLLQLFG